MLNHALENSIRIWWNHVCWEFVAARTTDVRSKDIDLALLVNANGLTFEAANARHARSGATSNCLRNLST